MKKIMLVFGTRPEAIKMCPLVRELRTRAGINTVVCVTGQHREMLDGVLDAFGITADYDLSVMREDQTLFDITQNVLFRIRPVLEAEKPDLVLVHGDTTTAFASALACFYLGIPVGHVEAGLRTHNVSSPYPEEFNRRAVGILAAYHFAPTETAKANLIAEGVDESTVFVTGNTVIDAIRTTVKDSYSHPLADAAGCGRLVLVTAHRRENLGEPMLEMFRAVRRVIDAHADVTVICPVHPNPAVREAADKIFRGSDRIHVTCPLNVIDFHNILSRSYLVLTDSGGIQEEASALGKPVLVMRDNTERPEGVLSGNLMLVGTSQDRIAHEFSRILDCKDEYIKMTRVSNPYGDGDACRRIADILTKA